MARREAPEFAPALPAKAAEAAAAKGEAHAAGRGCGLAMVVAGAGLGGSVCVPTDSLASCLVGMWACVI